MRETETDSHTLHRQPGRGGREMEGETDRGRDRAGQPHTTQTAGEGGERWRERQTEGETETDSHTLHRLSLIHI